MKTVTYKDVNYVCRDDENMLDALQRQGAVVPLSCRSGICQVCMLRSEHGTVPPKAQKGIEQELRDKGYFLPCVCHPVEDMEITDPQMDDLFINAEVVEKLFLAQDLAKILLEPTKEFSYRAGQFINIRHPDGAVRSYSLASTPEVDFLLELHIRHQPGGILSSWLCDTVKVGDTLSIQGPEGDCYYHEEYSEKSLLLIGTGTGLAPLVGVAREALDLNIEGEIFLYHGGRHFSDFYLHDFLNQLADEYPKFHYKACLSGKPKYDMDNIERIRPIDSVQGRASDIALSRHADLEDFNVHLAGSPEMVASTEKALLERGQLPKSIYTDPFTIPMSVSVPEVSETTSMVTAITAKKDEESKPTQQADPELWQALEEGVLLGRILDDFYSQVFEDPQLAPYFKGVTQQRLREKQFLFLRQLITGEKVYFGDRPRNAHHWMVISDELFDYREEIMLNTLRRHGLAEPMVQRLRVLEEQFRADIVKDEPFSKKIGDVEMPLDGYGETVLEVGSLCDSCGEEIDPGETVSYHLRLGSLYCPLCMTAGA